MPTKFLDLRPTSVLVLSLQDTQEFNSDYYKSQEYLEERRESSCKGGSEDGDYCEVLEEGGGLENLLSPPKLLNAAQNYGATVHREKHASIGMKAPIEART